GMPEKIMSHCSFGRYYDIEVEDDVTAFMQYENGMTGVYITSTGEAPGTNRLEIACDMGRVVVEDNKIIHISFNNQNDTTFLTVDKLAQIYADYLLSEDSATK
ncbi:MAG: hypothetical protein J6J05_00570, partial [Peptococcaceae bacterium]|nr:hypothetical protein [Peptococcaceae bacterium]